LIGIRGYWEAEFSLKAFLNMGYPGVDMARFLGISKSAVNRLANSEEIPEIEKYL
jgi:hypothetical protein